MHVHGAHEACAALGLNYLAPCVPRQCVEGSIRLMVVAAIAASVLAVSVVAAVAVIAIDESDPSGGGAGAGGNGATHVDGAVQVLDSDGRDTDVSMPTKVSRPGCEETDGCYVPSVYEAPAGEPITWTNEDSAFHTVTAGTYDSPAGTFDSGYMDPYDSYTLSFKAPGTYKYYCTLHPWMEGTVIITP